MCKTDRTLIMESTLCSFFKENFNIDMHRECRLPTGGIADLVGAWFGQKGTVEDFVFIEIKQSKQDLKYGHGHNFVGTSNYIAVPTELVGEALLYLRDTCKDFRTGVIEVTKSWKTRIVKYPMLEFNNIFDKELTHKIALHHGGVLTPHIYKTLEGYD